MILILLTILFGCDTKLQPNMRSNYKNNLRISSNDKLKYKSNYNKNNSNYLRIDRLKRYKKNF